MSDEKKKGSDQAAAQGEDDIITRAQAVYFAQWIQKNGKKYTGSDYFTFATLQAAPEEKKQEMQEAAAKDAAAHPEKIKEIAARLRVQDQMRSLHDDEIDLRFFAGDVSIADLQACFGDQIPLKGKDLKRWDQLWAAERWEILSELPFKQYVKLWQYKNPDLTPPESAFQVADDSFLKEPDAIESATFKEITKIDYPLDKINNNVWRMIAQEESGQLSFLPFAAQDFISNMLSERDNQQALVFCRIDFNTELDGVKISKTLTPYDKRVYNAVSALYQQGKGNRYISISQIYEKMGYIGRPGVNDEDRIKESLEKMQKAYLYISNTRKYGDKEPDPKSETAVLKNSIEFEYKDSLLPIAFLKVKINNMVAIDAVKPHCEPPLVSFARSRGQLTTIDVNVLQSPISKTNANLLIDDYLIERISFMKRAKGKRGSATRPKILFETLFKECGITQKKQKQRAPEKIYKYLDHYMKCNFISGYVKEPDGVTIKL